MFYDWNWVAIQRALFFFNRRFVLALWNQQSGVKRCSMKKLMWVVFVFGLFQREGVLAKWLARWTSDLAVWVRALAGGTGLCSSAKHFTLRPRPHVFGYFFYPNFLSGFKNFPVHTFRMRLPSGEFDRKSRYFHFRSPEWKKLNHSEFDKVWMVESGSMAEQNRVQSLTEL